MSQPKKLSQHQKQHEQQASHQMHGGQEFGSPEELLRFDAAQTQVPEHIARNLQKSAMGIQPPAGRPWWKRMFGA